MIYNLSLTLIFNSGEGCRSENTLIAAAIETENSKHIARSPIASSNRLALLGRKLNLRPVRNWNLMCGLTNHVSDPNAVALREPSQVMRLRRVIAGDLKEILATPYRFPLAQRVII